MKKNAVGTSKRKERVGAANNRFWIIDRGLQRAISDKSRNFITTFESRISLSLPLMLFGLPKFIDQFAFPLSLSRSVVESRISISSSAKKSTEMASIDNDKDPSAEEE